MWGVCDLFLVIRCCVVCFLMIGFVGLGSGWVWVIFIIFIILLLVEVIISFFIFSGFLCWVKVIVWCCLVFVNYKNIIDSFMRSVKFVVIFSGCGRWCIGVCWMVGCVDWIWCLMCDYVWGVGFCFSFVVFFLKMLKIFFFVMVLFFVFWLFWDFVEIFFSILYWCFFFIYEFVIFFRWVVIFG